MRWQLHNINPNDDWIYQLKEQPLRQAQFLVRYKLAKAPQCEQCLSHCALRSLQVEWLINRNKLPFRWYCSSLDCNTSYAFLHGSYLNGRRLSIFKHIQLLYKFYLKRNAKAAAKELSVGHDTVKEYFDFFRRCINHYMQNHFYPNFQFTNDFAIEWDEAALSAKQKHNRGRYREPVWVLGGVQRTTNYILLKQVNLRNQPTVHGIMCAHSEFGATHITDGWGGYFGLNNYGYSHWTVNHSEGFVDPYHGYHTNTIEGLWALIRGDLRGLRGIKADKLQLHLDVFAFRRNMSMSDDGLWSKLLLVIGSMQSFIDKPCL